MIVVNSGIVGLLVLGAFIAGATLALYWPIGIIFYALVTGFTMTVILKSPEVTMRK